MKAEELENKLSSLGYKAFAILAGVELDEDGQIEYDEEKFENLYQNPKKHFDLMDEGIINEIRRTYSELVERSFEEKYYCLGANYKIMVNSIIEQSYGYDNHKTGYENDDFIRVSIKNLKYTLKHELISIEELTPEFEVGAGRAYLLFLQRIPFWNIERNIKKTIKILKKELTKIERSKYINLEEIVKLDKNLSKSDKLGYLLESGILNYLSNTNSPAVISKFLMKFIDFGTDKSSTIERYIKICLNEPEHIQYPKNVEDVNDYLDKIKFKKAK